VQLNKERTKQKALRLLSSVLAAVTIVLCFPVSIFAAERAVSAGNTAGSPGIADTAQINSSTESRSKLTTVPEIALAGNPYEAEELTRLPMLEKDIYTIAYTDFSGTCTVKYFSHPVKFVDADGKIKDISLEIKSNSSGGFQSVANSVVTKFPQKFTDGISLEYDDIKVELIPVKNSTKNPSIEEIVSVNATLSEDKKKVSYAFGEKTRLDYALTYTGFKEDIVVESYTGQTEYSFFIKTNGLSLVDRNGSYFIEDGEGNVKATIGDIIIFTADERNNTFGSMTHTVVKENEIYAMTVHVDAEFLKDPKTVYPIRIDPTIEVNYGNNGAGAILDATINDVDPISTTSGSLCLGKYGDDQSVSRILMRFPGINFTQYTPAQITSATVSIRDLQPGTTGTMVSCYRFDGNVWSEGGSLTWSGVNGDAYSNLQDQHTVSYTNGNNQTTAYWYNFDITAVAKQWAGSSAIQGKGIIFKASDTTEEGTNHVYKTFGSYNRASYKPTLTVVCLNPIGSISFDNTELQLAVGESDNVLAVIENAVGDPVYVSSDESVATVDSTGEVTALALGTAIITGTITDFNGDTWSDECVVYVGNQNASISFPTSYIEITEGSIVGLNTVVTPSNLTVTYASSNPDIARVTNSGYVTGVRCGTATITASVTDDNNVTHYAQAIIMVHLIDGVFSINNKLSGYYLHVKDGKGLGVADVCECPQQATLQNMLPQLWHIKYLGGCSYELSPAHDKELLLMMLLDDVMVDNTTNKRALPTSLYKEWEISWDDGYIFTADGNVEAALQIDDTLTNHINGNVFTGNISTGNECRWGITYYNETFIGVSLYDSITRLPAQNAARYMDLNRSLNISELYLTTVINANGVEFSGITLQSLTPDILTVNSSSGKITAISAGSGTIKVSCESTNPSSLYGYININVLDFESGIYYFRNAGTGRFVEAEDNVIVENNSVCLQPRSTNITQGWIFELCTYDGSYTIQSKSNSEYYIQSTDSVNLHAGEITDSMKWYISETSGNRYKITSKAGQSNGIVLQTPDGNNGSSLIASSYTNNDDYKDEWIFFYNLNVVVSVDQAFAAKHPNLLSWLEKAMKNAIEFYRGYGIKINCTYELTPVQTLADECSTNTDNLQDFCECIEDYNCTQATAPFDDAELYHHTDLANMLFWGTRDLSLNPEISILFIDHDYSYKKGGSHQYTNTEGNVVANGLASEEHRRIIIGNTGDNTVAHEIGHMFSIVDHYDSTEQGIDHCCIYGRNDTKRLCADCESTLIENISKYAEDFDYDE